MSEMSSSATGRSFLTGRKVVASMFVMGICATAFLYGYWTLHLMPFMPLQEAIVAEFPGSAPRVNGGKKKLHKDTPTILQIGMKLKFDPTGTDAVTVGAVQNVQSRIHELVKQKVNFPELDIVELYIYQLQQERDIRERSFRLDYRQPTEWTEVDLTGNPIIENRAASESGPPTTVPPDNIGSKSSTP
ncbi:MAG: hypothetical protein DWH78_12725 [Planctomycetota bacterium]|jgi:hypothetical protein|nr:MAG: hypothetical protein DWH78_12725 [Planctomycetota bacterium]